MTAATLTPPELAQRWRVSPEKVVAMIRKGLIHGFDVSLPGSKRPRYRINFSEVIAFENRSTTQPVKAVRRKRKKQAADFVEYF